MGSFESLCKTARKFALVHNLFTNIWYYLSRKGTIKDEQVSKPHNNFS